jgi:sugar phosphate isomerase/epimerase
VKLGLLTAALPELGLEEIAGWASAAGFETLEIAC